MLLDQCMNLRGDNTTSRVGHGDLTDCRDRLRTCNFRKNESIHQCKFNGRLYIKLAPERDKQNNSTLLRAKYLTNFSSWMIIVISVDECLPTVSDFESALWLAQLYTMEAQGYIQMKNPTTKLVVPFPIILWHNDLPRSSHVPPMEKSTIQIVPRASTFSQAWFLRKSRSQQSHGCTYQDRSCLFRK